MPGSSPGFKTKLGPRSDQVSAPFWLLIRDPLSKRSLFRWRIINTQTKILEQRNWFLLEQKKLQKVGLTIENQNFKKFIVIWFSVKRANILNISPVLILFILDVCISVRLYLFTASLCEHWFKSYVLLVRQLTGN